MTPAVEFHIWPCLDLVARVDSFALTGTQMLAGAV